MSLPIKLKMKAKKKNFTGKGYNVRLREKERIPAIIYGNGCKNEMINIDTVEFTKTYRLARERSIIELDIDGTKKNVIIRAYQMDPIKRIFTHVDFYEVQEGKILETRVPIKLVGTPVGVRTGGVLEQYLTEINIKCLPKDMPESLEIDISELEVKQGILVRDLNAPEGTEIRISGDINVARVVPSRKTKTDEEEDAAGAPAEGEGEGASETAEA